MAKDAPAAPAPPPAAAAPAAPAAPAAAPASAPAPAKASVDWSEPVVRKFERQYMTDFAEGEGGHDAADAKPPAIKADAEDPKVDELKPDSDVEVVPDDTKPKEPKEGEEAKEEEKPAALKPEVISREERRRLLESVNAEATKRQTEASLAQAVQRATELETKLKTGTLSERLALLGIDKDTLTEALISGEVDLPAATTAAKPGAVDPKLKALEDEIAALKQAEQQRANLTVLNQIASMTSEVPKPFTNLEGPGGLNKIHEVCRAMYKMQGEKGKVDVVRAALAVEEHFESQFVAKYGEAAAAAIKGAAGGAASTPAAAAAPTGGTKRPAVGRRTGAASKTQGDPLPLDRDARHGAIFREIQAAEGLLPDGPT